VRNHIARECCGDTGGNDLRKLERATREEGTFAGHGTLLQILEA
jgi:hypothetical protein